MNRNIASALAMGTAAAAAVAAAIVATTPGYAYAESIADYTTPFTSTASRADVQADLARQAGIPRAASSEWLMQQNHLPPLKSSYASGQAQAEYQASRLEVNALTGEDSGSAYLARTADSMRTGASAMGGPAR